MSIHERISMKTLSRSRNSGWVYPSRKWGPEGTRHCHFWKASTREVKMLSPEWLLLSPASWNPPAWTTCPLTVPFRSAFLVFSVLKLALESYSGKQVSRSTSSRHHLRALPRNTRGSHLHPGFCWGKGHTSDISVVLSQLAHCFSVLPKRTASTSVISNN